MSMKSPGGLKFPSRVKECGNIIGKAAKKQKPVKKKFCKGSSKARGTGIGLAVCDEIVAMHNGTLDLSNAEGGGTRVRISLPLEQ